MKYIIVTQCVIILMLIICLLLKEKENRKHKYNLSKYIRLNRMMNRWVQIKQEGKKITDYTKDRYKTIAIYGFGYAGERLQDDFENDGIKIDYIIDQNANNLVSSIEIYSMQDELPEVDLVIVTSIMEFSEIKKMLGCKIDSEVVSLEEILFEL